MLKRLLTILLIVTLVGCSQQSTFTDSTGAKISTSKLSGHWVVIDYWASWCGDCKQEVAHLNNFYKEHQNNDVLLYGVNYDGWTGPKLQAAIKAMKIQYPVLQNDPSTLLSFEGSFDYSSYVFY